VTTLRCQDLTLQDQILEKYRVLTKAQTLHTFFSQRLSYHPIIKKLISRLSDVRTTVKKLLDLVNSVVIKCSLSLKDGTDKSTCKKNISKAKNGTELARKLQESV